MVKVINKLGQPLVLDLKGRGGVYVGPYGKTELTDEEIASEEFQKHSRFFDREEIPPAMDNEVEEDEDAKLEPLQKRTRNKRG